MTFPTDITRIGIAGDWHDNWKYIWKVVKRAHEKNTQVILQVGDFGYWEDRPGYGVLSDWLKERDMWLMFIDGNHENFPLLYSKPVHSEGYRHIEERIIHLPRGFRWKWEDRTFTALGGATSIDRGWREPGLEWFPEEDITLGDAARTSQEGHTDILLTHDAPQSIIVPFEPVGLEIPHYDLHRSATSRYLLDKVMFDTTPNYLFHGHYHTDYETTQEYHTYKKNEGKFRLDYDKVTHKTHVTGLNCDRTAFPRNIRFFDLTTDLF